MSFTKFPEFQKLTVQDHLEYAEYFGRLTEPCSDLSFDNALIWLDFHNDLEVSDLFGNLIIRFTNVFEDDNPTYSLMGGFNLNNTLDSLFVHFKNKQITPRLSYISRETSNAIEKLHLPGVNIREDLDNRDYIYRVGALAKLEGRQYENLRGRVNNFRKDNPNAKFKQLDLNDSEIIKEIRLSILRWSTRNEFIKNDPKKWGIAAITKHLEVAHRLTTEAYGLYSDKKMICVAVVHYPPQRGWMIINHIQYDYDYREIYGYTTHRLALVAQANNIEWINFEQDLGIEGLQRIKTLFRPEKFIRRYTVSFAPDFKNQ